MIRFRVTRLIRSRHLWECDPTIPEAGADLWRPLRSLVADSGPRAGHHMNGTLSIAPNDTLHRYYVDPFGQGWRRHGERPLIGWAQLRGDVGLMTAGVPIDSRDRAFPGVSFDLDSLRGGLHFTFGYRPMLDGGYNDFVVTAAGGDAFSGRWTSSLGTTTYRATGYFCAQQRSTVR